MEIPNFKQNTSSPQGKYRYTFWGIWGPVILNWLISGTVGFVAILAMTVIFVSGNEEMVELMFTDDAIKTQIAETLMNQYYNYSTFIQGAASLITIPIMLKFFKKDRKILNGYEAEYKNATVQAFAASSVLFLMAGFVMNSFLIIGNFSAYSESYQTTMEAFYSAPIIVQLFVLAIIVPACEELVFRGLVYKRFRAYEGFWKSAIGSAVIFAIVHGNLVQCLYAFFLGLLLAYVYEKMGTLKAPIIGHAVMNAFSIIATELCLFDYLTTDIIKIGTATVICSAVGATMFVAIKDLDLKMTKKEEE